MDRKTEAQLELISKSEKRRLMLMGGLLAVAFTWVFFRPHTKLDLAADDAALIPVKPQSMDPAVALDILKRHEEAQAGGAAAPLPAFQVDRDVLLSVKDGELDVVEEPAFYQLLARVHSLSDQELAKLPEAEGTWSWDQLHNAAGRDQARGKFARLQGRFWTPLFQRVLVKYPNEAGLAWVWQGTFREHNRGYFVTITDKTFEPKPGAYGDNIELTGAFLKIYAFEVQDDKEGPIKSYPHLIVKSARRLPQTAFTKPGDAPSLPAVMMVVLISIAGIVAYLYVRGSRKSEARIDAWRLARVQKNAREALKATLEQAAAEDAARQAAAATSTPAPVGAPVATASPTATPATSAAAPAVTTAAVPTTAAAPTPTTGPATTAPATPVTPTTVTPTTVTPTVAHVGTAAPTPVAEPAPPTAQARPTDAPGAPPAEPQPPA